MRNKTFCSDDLLVTEDNHHYWKEWEKDTKFGLRKYWVCAYGDKYGCKSHLTTTMDSQFVNWGLKNVPHNLAASIIKTEGIKLRNQIKEDTKKGKTRKPKEIKLETYLANAQVPIGNTNIFKAKVWRSCKLYRTFTP